MHSDHVYIVAELGINHQGNIDITRQLIKAAHDIGVDAVKFQKRTINVVYTREELDQPRKSVFGKTNRDLKEGLEFDRSRYEEIDRYCKLLGIDWFASPWDVESALFLSTFNPKYLKIASASATDAELVKYCCGLDIPLIVATGMCDLSRIADIVDYIKRWNGDLAYLLHCTSTYPSKPEELNLLGIRTLIDRFADGKTEIGYSGHEGGVPTSVMAAALGARYIERHITLNRSWWGSDQAASLDVEGFRRMVRDIRLWERAKGDGEIVVYESEQPIIEKLRRHDNI